MPSRVGGRGRAATAWETPIPADGCGSLVARRAQASRRLAGPSDDEDGGGEPGGADALVEDEAGDAEAEEDRGLAQGGDRGDGRCVIAQSARP